MIAERIDVLLVEDNPGDVRLIRESLAEAVGSAFDVQAVDQLDAALQRLDSSNVDVVLLDLGLPDSTGPATFETAYREAPNVPIIVLTGLRDEELAVRMLHEGAQDYLIKGQVDARALMRAIRYAVERHRLQTNYRSLIENAPYGIYRSDLDGRFLIVNPAMVELLGYDRAEEVLDLDIARDVYVDADERASLVAQYVRGEGIRGFEVQWRRRDGQEITVRLSGRPVRDKTGQIAYFEMIAEDATHQKNLEAQLRQAQKMEAVGQLSGGIAHDFNNLLTVIMGNTDVILGALPQQSDDLRADLEEIQGAVQRGADLIKKLLGFSRHETLEVKSVNLADLVHRLADVLRRVVPEHIEIRLQPGEAVGTARVDPGAVEQMVFNLVTNARDAMPDGGVLTIEVERAWLDEGYLATHPWCAPGEYVALAIHDTGKGMDPETVDRIFEPFFTTKPAGLGTGLGLAMVYGLMKQHGGFVHVYSEVGSGTVVKLLFPVTAEAADARPHREKPAILPRGSETILLVEDELAIRRATKRALESHGYTVLLSENGEEALEVYREHRAAIQLIIADLVMPKLGGRQLYQALSGAGESVKLLFASGYSASEVSERGALPESVPFLRKPWTLSDLLVGVRDILDQEPSTPETPRAPTPNL